MSRSSTGPRLPSCGLGSVRWRAIGVDAWGLFDLVAGQRHFQAPPRLVDVACRFGGNQHAPARPPMADVHHQVADRPHAIVDQHLAQGADVARGGVPGNQFAADETHDAVQHGDLRVR